MKNSIVIHIKFYWTYKDLENKEKELHFEAIRSTEVQWSKKSLSAIFIFCSRSARWNVHLIDLAKKVPHALLYDNLDCQVIDLSNL